MKRIMLVMAFALSALTATVKAQGFVRVGIAPPPVFVVRPPSPGVGRVWVDGTWGWNRRMNQRMWVNGYWARPHRGWGCRGRYRF